MGGGISGGREVESVLAVRRYCSGIRFGNLSPVGRAVNLPPPSLRQTFEEAF